jgi:hypothetical protein
VAACTPPANAPDSYTEPIVSTTLEANGTTTSTEVSQAAANFLGGCLSNGASLPECECIFDFFSLPVDDPNIPFDEFADLDDQLADNPESLPDNVKVGIEACKGGGSSTAPDSTPEGTGTTVVDGPAGTTETSVPQ